MMGVGCVLLRLESQTREHSRRHFDSLRSSSLDYQPQPHLPEPRDTDRGDRVANILHDEEKAVLVITYLAFIVEINYHFLIDITVQIAIC